MSFENGYNMFAYVQDIFRKYKDDTFVFMKAIQTVQYFETRPDFPYSISELDEAISNILDQSLTEMSDGIYKHILIKHELKEWNIRDEDLIYGEETSLVANMTDEEINIISNNFKNELKSFCLTLSPVFDKIFLMQDSPMKLSRITISEPLPTSESTMRLIRNDGKTMDLIVDDSDIKFIIDTLENKING